MINWDFYPPPQSEPRPYHDMEGFYKISGPPCPLQTGERHCPKCRGYGHLPRTPDPTVTHFCVSVQCDYCCGTGKENDESA